jgi:hypothetical protein
MGYVIHLGEVRNAYRMLVGKCKGKKSVGRHRHRWEDNFKIGLKRIGYEGWTRLIWFRIGNN